MSFRRATSVLLQFISICISLLCFYSAIEVANESSQTKGLPVIEGLTTHLFYAIGTAFLFISSVINFILILWANWKKESTNRFYNISHFLNFVFIAIGSPTILLIPLIFFLWINY